LQRFPRTCSSTFLAQVQMISAISMTVELVSSARSRPYIHSKGFSQQKTKLIRERGLA